MSETKKHREFWIKDHKVARTETKGYLYDAFDLLPALDKSVGIIHVVEASALLEEKQKVKELVAALNLIRTLHKNEIGLSILTIERLIKKYGDV
jgi:hypothetical protein